MSSAAQGRPSFVLSPALEGGRMKSAAKPSIPEGAEVRCERRMRLKDSVARDDLAGTMPDAGHEAGEPATDASAR